jgi:hypothetical protein
VVGNNILFSFPMRTIALYFTDLWTDPGAIGKSRWDGASGVSASHHTPIPGERDAASFATGRRGGGDAPALAVGAVFRTAPFDPVDVVACGDTGFSE